ncbi:unnamed protein product [Arabidopsis halleri]
MRALPLACSLLVSIVGFYKEEESFLLTCQQDQITCKVYIGKKKIC